MSEFNPLDYSKMAVSKTSIDGLFKVNLVVFGDNRGWFKENYHQKKMEKLGLPHFEPIQNNFSFNQEVGVTRGLHAEPWDKFISVSNGRVLGAWVDLRPGKNFGQSLTIEINPGVAVYVPRGVANGYQTLEPNVTYTYLVNDYWSENSKYTYLNLFDKDLAIDWPIKQDKAIVSDKDKLCPSINELKTKLNQNGSL